MTLRQDSQEITIEVRSSVEGNRPTKEDVEQAIQQKLDSYPTQLFVNGDTVILKCENVGGKK